MTATYLDGTRLRGALVMASEYVQRHRADLNRINVFPVPDGDTGTNLALTVSSIADRLRTGTDDSVGAVAREAAEAGILGARGNCGMILSHFLLGFSEAVGDRVRLTVGEFTAALKSATEHVYRALERPVEGTMITIMRAISEEAERLRGMDFVSFFQRLLEKAREALASTPDLLPALRARGVVDAGAKGFVHILEGIASYLAGDPVVALDEVPAYAAEPLVAAEVEYPAESERFRFCTEALVRGPDIPDQDAVRAVLREQGDSLVVIRAAGLLKVHIHTDDPEGVFRYLRGVGELVTHKAEDMQVQHAAMGRAASGGHLLLARRPISIVADTACDLPDEVVRQHGIHLVPLNLIFEDRVLRDRFDISAEEFGKALKEGAHPSTSQPAPAAFQEVFRRAAEEGEAVLGVILSGALSGTLASAKAAAKLRAADDVPVHLCDSAALSLLQGLMVLKAAELGELGWEPERIVEELNRIRKQSGFYVTLDTFERAVASGRVGRGRAWLGSLLNIKPILDFDPQGKAVPLDRVRGRENVFPRMMEILDRRVARTVRKVRFGIAYSSVPEVVEPVTREIRKRFPQADIVAAPITPVLATHAGEGAWGIAYLIED